jgi:NAD(P)-dependent dehydrogenase (short-subunit alcohol dehydrogenase family)
MPSVLITGASRGIGRATASRLAGQGWEVLAGVRNVADVEAGDDASGGSIRPVRLDISDPADIAALDDALPDRLDAVVNNAGIVVGGPVEGVAVDALRRQLEVNVIGQVAVTQAVLPRIRTSHGRIVFVSSLSGRVSGPMLGPYSASKFALEAMADALRLELRPWHIPVVLVEPAQTDTDMWSTANALLDETVAGLSPEIVDLYRGHIDGQRKSIPSSQKMAGPVDGVAEVIERALTAKSPRARYVVGTGPRIMGGVVRFIPTRILDAAMAATSGVPRRVP